MGMLDDILSTYADTSGLLNQKMSDYYDAYKDWGSHNKEVLPEWLNRTGDIAGQIAETPGLGEFIFPMAAMPKINPSWKEAMARDKESMASIANWLRTKSNRPAAPTEIYRGIPSGAEPVINEAGYTHATPWLYDAGRAGKGIFGDFRSNDIYSYPANTNTKYYRGGSLAGDPFETTKINSASGMTWDEILDQANALYKQELHKANNRYLGVPNSELLRLDEEVANKVSRAVRNATFETDISGKPGIWSGREVPPALGKERPIMRHNDMLRQVISRMKALGLSEDEIVNLPEYKILLNAGQLTK